MAASARGRKVVVWWPLAAAAVFGCSSTATNRTTPVEAGSPDASAGSSGSAGTGGSGGARPDGGGSGGTGGSAGTSSGGGAGAGGSSGDAGATVEIQRIQDGTLPADRSVHVGKVYVTALRQTAPGNLELVVQEPQGETPPEHTYPEYAGVQVHAAPADPDAAVPPIIGDCVDVFGVTTEFQTRTQIAGAALMPATACGTPPSTLTIPTTGFGFADVATDVDLATAGNQPGPKAELLESVLVRVTNVRVSALPSADSFEVVERANPTGPKLLVLGIYHAAAVSAGQEFVSITGILSQSTGYRLLPRSAADLVE